MEFKAAKCPSCAGVLKVPDDRTTIKCMYCGLDISVDEAVRLAISDEADNSGIVGLHGRCPHCNDAIMAKAGAETLTCGSCKKAVNVVKAQFLKPGSTTHTVTPRQTKSPTGCLIVVGVILVVSTLICLVGGLLNPADHTPSGNAVSAGENVPQKKSQAEAIAQFKAKIDSIKEVDGFILDIRTGDHGDGWARIEVSPDWHALPKGQRMEIATLLWKGWASYSNPTHPDSAFIEIYDQSGRKIGGSGVMGIYVED